MTKEEICKLIEKRKDELAVPYEKDEAYDFFKDFINNNRITKPSDLLNVDMTKLLQCLYYLQSDDKSLEECITKISYIMPVVMDVSLDDLNGMALTYNKFYEEDKFQEILDYIQEEDASISKEKLEKIYPYDSAALDVIVNIKNAIVLEDEEGLLVLLKMFLEEFEMIMGLLSFLKAFKVMEKEKYLLDFEIKELDCNVRKKDKDRELNYRIKNIVCTETIALYFQKIENFVVDSDRNEKKYNKNCAREVSGLDSAFIKLEKALGKEEIVQYREIVNDIMDEEIKKAFLTLIFEHNYKYYQKLETEYDCLCENTKAKYIALLKDYEIECDENTVELIRENRLDDLKKILEVISKFNLDKEIILSILTNTDLETVLRVLEYFEAGIINLDFIKNNISIFNKKSEKLLLISKNLELLKSFNVNPCRFCSCLNVLLANPLCLSQGLKVMENYNLLTAFKTTDRFEFLLDDNLNEKIDKLLELGYEKYLMEDIGILNCSNLGRLEVVKSLFMEIQSVDELKEVLENDFFIEDAKLDDYIPSIVPYKEKIDFGDDYKILAGYKNTSRTYNINGILISSVKVMRLVDSGIDLYDAMFSNLNLSEYEYNLVTSALCDRKENRL